ncbi:MAG: hypothetical protein JNJ92_04870 [Altererythrobacter sp.]|nr:hypothetical protein [Altererythrobacter sp.]
MIELLWTNRGSVQTLAVTGLFALALVRGASPERWCAGILLTAILLARAQQLVASGFDSVWGLSGFATAGLAYFVIDLATFAALTAVALKANRIYPLWMAGVQLTALITHIAERTTAAVSPLAYAILNLSTFYLAIAFLAVGLMAHVRRSRSWGPYPNWRSGLAHSPEPTPWPSRAG